MGGEGLDFLRESLGRMVQQLMKAEVTGWSVLRAGSV